MDPNAALIEARKLVTELRAWQDGGEDPDEPGEYYRIASELAEAFDGLDGWIIKGGFLPKGWEGPLTMAVAGNWTDNERAARRLETVFSRVVMDDEELDKTLDSARRSRLIRLLAREVIEEANRERAKIEEILNSQVTRTFIANATEAALKRPATWVLVDPDADLPGFTPEGMRLIREARERNAAEDGQ